MRPTCPNCGFENARLLTTADKEGKLRQGCTRCIGQMRRLYTGRKLWTGYQAYGKENTMQKNRDWIEKVAERAAHMRRTAHHSRM